MLFRVASLVALLIAVFWVWFEPKFESWAALAAAVAALIGSVVATRKSENGQVQTVSEQGTGVQAGRDANVKITK